MINFNIPTYTNHTIDYISDVLKSGHTSGDGKYTNNDKKG